ncbi:uncharacterized protein LOC128984924 [Macrosteles quadrilineatus]|uniref:uncharacterized protein LOC128984924 n=1 Tax=Macrosteles quadrilineatus TaxID=74068 RepID=UPI0023E2BD89|nr:uncharacterized protein LOC128984924 [Macrosteles quadrilineatus]
MRRIGDAPSPSVSIRSRNSFHRPLDTIAPEDVSLSSTMSPWRCLLLLVLHLAFSPSSVAPTTSYTQVNHDEPTNAVKETTVTSDQEDLRAPGVGERDLLWDHVGDLTQHLVLGAEPFGSSTPGDLENANTTATMANQIENSVEGSNSSQTEYVSKAPKGARRNNGEESAATPQVLMTSTDKSSDDSFGENRANHSDVQGKLILYPTDRKLESHNTESAMGNITKNIMKSLSNKTKTYRPKIIYDTSDPFSVIFGEVRTEFKTDKSINVTNEERENIIAGLAVRKVHDLLKKEDSGKTVFKGKETTTTFKNFEVHNFEEEEERFGSEQEEREITESKEVFQFGKIKSRPSEDILFPKNDRDHHVIQENNDLRNAEQSADGNQKEKNLFKEWDTVSEEQEKMLEDMVIKGHDQMDSSNRDVIPPPGRWFILLLAGNSTIVKLRQKDFAKYLKLNLAARLSLEYDEVKVNRVILAPPRLMVNVSVVPANEGGNQDLDEELDLEDKIFGEEEAPLHKLAETNATLLELSGEEYHVVRFLSLRSQQPIQMEDSPSATSMIVNDRHMDIELIIYVIVGGTCALAILVTFFFGLWRYLRTAAINWPWSGAKPRFTPPWSLPRHQRMGEEPTPSIGGPLTVIYSGNFVDRTAPSSGSWIDDCQPPSIPDPLESTRQPVYGFGALSNSALPEICDSFSNITHESPRFNLDNKLHILGCRPNHFLLPHQPARSASDHKNTLDVRIQGVGVDNPNYQS